MSKEQGFVKLNRGFFENSLWMEERIYSLAEAWLDLIQMARYDTTPEKILVKMKLITINRGELRASQRYLSTRWKWSLGKVNRFFKLLETEQMVERRVEHSETVVKLLKYDIFNPLERGKMNADRHTNGTPTEHQQVQTKEGKEREERKTILFKKESKRENITETDFESDGQNSETQEKEKSSAKKESFDFKREMLEYGFDSELTEEWIKIRKSKKAVNSKIAFSNFITQVEQSDRPPNEILKIITEKQWKGYNSEWLKNLQNGKQTNNTRGRSTGKVSGTQNILDGLDYFEFT